MSQLSQSRTIVWRRYDEPGMEHASLTRSGAGIELAGTAIAASGDRIDYSVACDRSWRTRDAAVRISGSRGSRAINLASDEEGRWRVEGEDRPDLAGCTDVDLGFSPSTNTLPICRLQLQIGQEADIVAAWVRPPALEVTRARQRYRRLAERLYRYESADADFRADVLVDEDALVVDYPPAWEAVGDGGLPRDESPLFSAGRAAHIGEDDDLYGWLVGSWDIDVIDYQRDGTRLTSTGEVHFAWVLEGRAIQDVWIMPPRARRRVTLPATGNRYGTTLRVYDPATGAWRVTWINPVNGAHNQLVGRRVGDDIVQEGREPNGDIIRWRFTDIRPDAFHWIGEISKDGGATWTPGAEFLARRTGTRPLR